MSEIFKQALPDNIRAKMEHCIGYDAKKVYIRNGVKRFKPRRNYYDVPKTKTKDWDNLVKLGYAERSKMEGKNSVCFWLTRSGLAALSDCTGVYIYSENASGNEIDAQYDVLEVLCENAQNSDPEDVLPMSTKEIANAARLPRELVTSTLQYLRDKCGYVKIKNHGEQDERGYPVCHKGWTVTKKWYKESEVK